MRSFDVGTFVLVPLLAFGVSGCSCGSDDSSDGSGSGGSSGAGVGGDGGTGGAEASTGGTGGTAGVSDAGEDVSDAGGDVVVDAAPDAEPMCSSAKPCTWKQATPTNSPPVLAWAA